MEDKKHSLVLNDRNSLSITGVMDIYSFEGSKVALKTTLGTLIITGEGLQINRLSIDEGNIEVNGEVDSCVYSESRELEDRGKSIFGRLFR